MPKIKTILFASDFSEASQPAADYAIMLARLTGAHLHILHVINQLEEPQRALIPLEAFQIFERKLERQAIEELSRFCRDRVNGLATTTHALVGVPFQKILDLSKKVDADLIVIGTHGRTGIEHILVGSTAERVVRQAGVPVLTVRSNL
jgi:nucleotide-binding universal stress UspA family protein